MFFLLQASVGVPLDPQPSSHGALSPLLVQPRDRAADPASTRAAYEGAKKLGESLGLSGAALGSFMSAEAGTHAQGTPASGADDLERYGTNGIVYA